MDRRNEGNPDLGVYIALGMSLGTAFGVVFGNIPMGAAYGLLAGIVYHSIATSRRNRDRDGS